MLRLGLAATMARALLAHASLDAEIVSSIFRSQSGRRITTGDYKPYRNIGFTGAQLREFRARNGAGRPPFWKREALKGSKAA